MVVFYLKFDFFSLFQTSMVDYVLGVVDPIQWHSKVSDLFTFILFFIFIHLNLVC